MDIQDHYRQSGARERILSAAYGLFTRQGINSVSVDDIVAAAGCARASVYNIFGSKEDLVVAYLDRREKTRTRVVMENELRQRYKSPADRLLGMFEIVDGWLNGDSVYACTLVKMLLESEPGSVVSESVSSQLAKVRALIRDIADEAELEQADEFASIWHMLIKGAIVSHREGHEFAALTARVGGEVLLRGWPRKPDGAV